MVVKDGIRCRLVNDLIHCDVEGPAAWRGGIAQGKDNYILSKDLPVECGINRALIRSLTTPGTVRITAKADGLQSAEISLSSAPVEVKNGLSNYIPGDELEGRLTRGETPLTPSYKDTKVDVNILSAVVGGKKSEWVKKFFVYGLVGWEKKWGMKDGWMNIKLGMGGGGGGDFL